MRRFMQAINITRINVEMSVLSAGFSEAVGDAIADGVSPDNDPAVLLYGAFIAFRTHADVNTVGGYKKLIELCHQQIEPRSLQ